jgi:hypothetical protein
MLVIVWGSTSIVADSADYESAAALLRRVSQVARATPPMAGAHDTHAAALDTALDAFSQQAGAAATALLVQAELLAAAAALAGRGLSALEFAIARALSP